MVLLRVTFEDCLEIEDGSRARYVTEISYPQE